MPVEVKLGMRRIGLAFGIFGAIAGGFVGYLFYTDLHAQALRYARFHQLLATPALARFRDASVRAMPRNPEPVHQDGIAAVHFGINDTRDLPLAERIDWIDTENGIRVYRAEEPTRAAYFLVALCPLLGFLLPWGIIRGVTWVLVGFMQSQES